MSALPPSPIKVGITPLPSVERVKCPHEMLAGNRKGMPCGQNATHEGYCKRHYERLAVQAEVIAMRVATPAKSRLEITEPIPMPSEIPRGDDPVTEEPVGVGPIHIELGAEDEQEESEIPVGDMNADVAAHVPKAIDDIEETIRGFYTQNAWLSKELPLSGRDEESAEEWLGKIEVLLGERRMDDFVTMIYTYGCGYVENYLCSRGIDVEGFTKFQQYNVEMRNSLREVRKEHQPWFASVSPTKRVIFGTIGALVVVQSSNEKRKALGMAKRSPKREAPYQE